MHRAGRKKHRADAILHRAARKTHRAGQKKYRAELILHRAGRKNTSCSLNNTSCREKNCRVLSKKHHAGADNYCAVAIIHCAEGKILRAQGKKRCAAIINYRKALLSNSAVTKGIRAVVIFFNKEKASYLKSENRLCV